MHQQSGMNAIELLEHDHRMMKSLLKRALEASAETRREELLDEIRTNLVAHERMEEEVFYPPLEEHAKTHDIVLEGYEEHHVADVILDELLQTEPGSDTWKAKLKVLKESLEHHIEEEEGEMFKKARTIFDDDELARLGEQMAEVRRSAVAG